MAGLYCDITLLASVGKETATNTISRQAILYSSSGLMFSAKHQPNHVVRKQAELVLVCRVCFQLTTLLGGQRHHQGWVNLTG